MTNLLRTKAAWLASMRQQHASDEVTYRRGADEITLRAQAVPVSYEIDQATGAIVEAQRWDWIVRREDLAFGGDETEPMEGDEIDHEVGDAIRTYTAMKAGTDAAAEPLDVDASQWRIHTRLTATQ